MLDNRIKEKHKNKKIKLTKHAVRLPSEGGRRKGRASKFFHTL